MRLPEQRLYDWFRRTLGAAAFIERVENKVKRDTPDMYIAEPTRQIRGWVELKVLPRWPARASTLVRLDHWTNGQRYWATRHALYGGRTWLVLQVEDQVLVFDAAAVASSSDWTCDDWLGVARRVGMRNAHAVDLLDALARCVV